MSKLTIEEKILMIKGKIAELPLSSQETVRIIYSNINELFRNDAIEFTYALWLLQCESDL